MSRIRHAGETTLALPDGEIVGTVIEEIDAGPVIGLLEIERPEDPPALLQDWCNRADPTLLIPYYAEIWPSSLAIVRALSEETALTGRSVLDLGCGLGVAGIAAAKLGANVTFADLHPDALMFAGRNAERAGVPFAPLLADWRDTSWARPYDLVLGADVLYERSEHEPMARLLEVLLDQGGKAYLADPGRESALPFFDEWKRGGGSVSSRNLGPLAESEVRLVLHELRRNP